jgi:uncharacterized protein (DUF849 family)
MKANPPAGTGQSKYPSLAISKEKAMAMFPIDREPKITTLDKPVIIETSCPGWQVGGARFPAVPITIKDQIRELTDSVKAGAVAVHVHPRNPKTGDAELDARLMKEVMDGVFANVGDCITMTSSWYPVARSDGDYITHTEELLELGEGNKYVQGAVVLPVGHFTNWNGGTYFSAKATVEGIKWMEAHSVKPDYLLRDTYSHLGFKEHLFDHGVSTWKPYLMSLNLGKHNSHTIQQDPWSFMQLITNQNMVKATVPESIIGVQAGGRNWLPIVTMGMLLGAEVFRVGIEDCYWIYPHKDDIIKKDSDVVKMTVEIANILGRRVITDADEARKILGMKLTSKL